MFDFSSYRQDEIRQANLDFSEYMKEEVMKLSVGQLPCTQERLEAVEEVTERFFEYFGEHMNTVCLYYLSNYLMQDFIKAPSRSKTMDQENGFLSPRQLVKRKTKEISMREELIDVVRVDNLFNIAKPTRRVNQVDF